MILTCAFLMTAGAAPARIPVRLVMVDPADAAITRRAYEVFRQSCPGLNTVAPLVDHVELRDLAIVGYDAAKDRHWPIAVSVQVHIQEHALQNLQTMGFIVPGISEYLLGSGDQTGIIPVGSSAAQLCWQRDADFIDAVDLTFLDAWPSLKEPSKTLPKRSSGRR